MAAHFNNAMGGPLSTGPMAAAKPIEAIPKLPAYSQLACWDLASVSSMLEPRRIIVDSQWVSFILGHSFVCWNQNPL